MPIRLKLVLGLGAIIALVSCGAVYLVLNQRQVALALDDVRRRSDDVRLSLTLSAAIWEQYSHEAHVILLPHPEEHVAHFDDAAKSGLNCMERLRETARSTRERGLIDRIAAEAERFRALFHDELLPALHRGDRDRAMMLHETSEAVLEDAVRLCDELSSGHLAEIDAAQHRADRLEAQAVEVGAAVLVVMTALAAVVAVYLVRAIHRPIAALARGTQAVAGGNLDARIHGMARDEFGALARGFNEMTARLRANQAELLRAEKAASLGQLAAGVAHQLNNPLGVIVGYAAILADPRYDEAARHRAIAAIRDEAAECRSIVQNLMALARPGSLELESVAVAPVLAAVLDKAQRYIDTSHLEVVVAASDALVVETDRKKLEQALLNLVVNAAEAMPSAGKLELAGVATTEGVSLSVTDTGVGMGAEDLSRLFGPYFTRKARGTGLGLAFAHALVRALGGAIGVDSEPGRGTRFVVALPRRAPAHAGAETQGEGEDDG